MKGTKSDVRFLLVLLAASLCGNVFLLRRILNAGAGPRPHTSTVAEFKDWLAKQPRQPIPIPADGAQVVVVKFNDYQCSPCRTTHDLYDPVIARLQAAHPGAIKFVVKDFPLESECNSTVTGSLHPAACEAAAAVRLAREIGKGDELAEWLYAHHASLTPESVWAAARRIAGRPYTDAEYKTALAGVKEDVALGATVGVSGTPTVFVNGMRMQPDSAQLFEVALERELQLATREAHQGPS